MHYSIIPIRGTDGMAELLTMFPEGKADSMNMVLFSTSGVHGSYTTLEEAEAWVAMDETTKRTENSGEDPDEFMDVTVLILQPRRVSMRYGVCTPRTPEDFAYLKRLRESSWNELQQIGKATP